MSIENIKNKLMEISTHEGQADWGCCGIKQISEEAIQMIELLENEVKRWSDSAIRLEKKYANAQEHITNLEKSDERYCPKCHYEMYPFI